MNGSIHPNELSTQNSEFTMIFNHTEFEHLYLIDIETNDDDRGYFARTWCKHELKLHGVDADIVQSSISSTTRKGTLRGLHYQKVPFSEDKIITCLSGAIYDVVIDLRIDSVSYLKWTSFYLTSDNKKMLFVPAGFAHGYQALKDESLVLYYSTEFYNPMAEMGIRYDDPFFNIKWPQKVILASAKDRSWIDFDHEKCPIFLTNRDKVGFAIMADEKGWAQL